MLDVPHRLAEFVMVFPQQEAETLRDALVAVPHQITARRSDGSIIVVLEGLAGGPQSAAVHLAVLWEKTHQFLSRVASCGPPPLSARLRLVQYTAPDDPVGPGVLIETTWIKVLAALGGSVDLDQYVLVDSERQEG